MRSRLPGFFKLDPDERLARALEAAELDPSLAEAWREGGLPVEVADRMVENVIGTFRLPAAVAVNMQVNGRDVLVPMVVEEPSVVAAVGNMARLARQAGGFTAEADPSVMIGQVELRDVRDPAAAIAAITPEIPRLTALAGARLPELVGLGGGVRGMELRALRYDEPGEQPRDLVVLHFFLDCLDAMGANMVNTVAEALAPELEALTGERAGLRILSNLADRRLARASVRLPPGLLGDDRFPGEVVAEGVAAAWRFAWADPYRAATHNKGIMNGVDPVVIATGNDWRAMEAGAHAFAARTGRYRPLTTWKVDAEGALVGRIELPVQVGTVGGTLRLHPTVRANIALLGVEGARELAAIIAAVGLAQNLGALKALATTGIQEGHMRLHARAVAVAAGAGPHEVAGVVATLVAARDFSDRRARDVLAALRAAR
ncbi:MAG: hydroxymethylglutaryl-CoA reductase, degradative [Pseudomonadota bacterium]